MEAHRESERQAQGVVDVRDQRQIERDSREKSSKIYEVYTKASATECGVCDGLYTASYSGAYLHVIFGRSCDGHVTCSVGYRT